VLLWDAAAVVPCFVEPVFFFVVELVWPVDSAGDFADVASLDEACWRAPREGTEIHITVAARIAM